MERRRVTSEQCLVYKLELALFCGVAWFYAHFVNEEMGAWSGEAACPSSQSQFSGYGATRHPGRHSILRMCLVSFLCLKSISSRCYELSGSLLQHPVWFSQKRKACISFVEVLLFLKGNNLGT